MTNGTDLCRLVRIFFLICCISFFFSSPLFSNQTLPEFITVGMYDNPPKLFVNDKGREKGIFPGIISYIAQKEGWKIKFVSLSIIPK